MSEKPAGRKNYGSIGHLPNSRMGSGDHHLEENQARIATENANNKDGKIREVFVQEKLDGSNVGIYRKDNRIFALSRSGYQCNTSPYEQHRAFERWVMQQQERWLEILADDERLVGEWLMQAHSTRYNITNEPFVAFDILKEDKRMIYDDFVVRINDKVQIPYLVHRGDAFPVSKAMELLGKYGKHGATDEIEGAIWRVEMIQDKNNKKRPRQMEFLAKYVRPEKKDGIFLKDESGNELPPIYNWSPK